MAGEKDIYIELMEDLLGGKPIAPEASIFEEDINTNMVKSCDDFIKVLGIKDKSDEKIDVGINGKKYLEPCPVAYTGKLDGKIFDTVFIGLNPYSEGAREDFPNDMTWGDLANIHHPNDIRHGYDSSRYKIPEEITEEKFPRNNYWRVFGNKERNKKGDSSWSSYYTLIFPIHVALHWNKIQEEFQLKPFTKWGEFREFYKNDKDVTDVILKILEKFPIANFEAIPYKSVTFKTNKYNELFTDNIICEQYKHYLKDMVKFIDKHSKLNAYIIITSKTSDMDIVADEFRKVMKEVSDNSLCTTTKGTFSREKEIFLPDTERISYHNAPVYLFLWGNRKVIITIPASNAGPDYSWIYYIPFKWVNAISKDENYKKF